MIYLEEYLELVETENLHKMCKEQKQLACMIRNILKTEDVYIDEERVEKYLSYQKYFPFDLFPWEIFLLVLMLCMFNKEDGTPRFSTLFCLVGRGAGKNALIAFLAFCLLSPTNGIKNYNIDIVANSEEQAKTSFFDVYNVLTEPKVKDKMKKNFKYNKEEIRNLKTNSTLKYKTSNAKSQDGLRPGAVIFDEVHQYENWKLIDVQRTGLGKIEHPRQFFITTDGNVRDAVLDEMKEKAKNILEGTLEDGGMLPFICKLDNEEEVHNEENFFKANPSLYYRPSLLKQIKSEYVDYKLSPYTNISFMTKRMNIPKSAEENPVTTWENVLATNQPIPYNEIEGYNCTVGIDYASVSDMVGACICIRKNCKYYIIGHAWICTNSKDLPKIKAPLKEWEQMGLLTFVKDVEVGVDVVMEWVQTQLEKYSFEHLALDNYRLSLMKRGLENINIDYMDRDEVTLVRPSDIMKIVPFIDSLFNKHKIVVGNNPLMRWSINNTFLEPKQNGNYVYAKIDPFRRKNDLFMAMVHSIIASMDRLEDWDEI